MLGFAIEQDRHPFHWLYGGVLGRGYYSHSALGFHAPLDTPRWLTWLTHARLKLTCHLVVTNADFPALQGSDRGCPAVAVRKPGAQLGKWHLSSVKEVEKNGTRKTRKSHLNDDVQLCGTLHCS